MFNFKIKTSRGGDKPSVKLKNVAVKASGSVPGGVNPTQHWRVTYDSPTQSYNTTHDLGISLSGSTIVCKSHDVKHRLKARCGQEAEMFELQNNQNNNFTILINSSVAHCAYFLCITLGSTALLDRLRWTWCKVWTVWPTRRLKNTIVPQVLITALNVGLWLASNRFKTRCVWLVDRRWQDMSKHLMGKAEGVLNWAQKAVVLLLAERVFCSPCTSLTVIK